MYSYISLDSSLILGDIDVIEDRPERDSGCDESDEVINQVLPVGEQAHTSPSPSPNPSARLAGTDKNYEKSQPTTELNALPDTVATLDQPVNNAIAPSHDNPPETPAIAETPQEPPKRKRGRPSKNAVTNKHAPDEGEGPSKRQRVERVTR